MASNPAAGGLWAELGLMGGAPSSTQPITAVDTCVLRGTPRARRSGSYAPPLHFLPVGLRAGRSGPWLPRLHLRADSFGDRVGVGFRWARVTSQARTPTSCGRPEAQRRRWWLHDSATVPNATEPGTRTRLNGGFDAACIVSQQRTGSTDIGAAGARPPPGPGECES